VAGGRPLYYLAGEPGNGGGGARDQRQRLARRKRKGLGVRRCSLACAAAGCPRGAARARWRAARADVDSVRRRSTSAPSPFGWVGARVCAALLWGRRRRVTGCGWPGATAVTLRWRDDDGHSPVVDAPRASDRDRDRDREWALREPADVRVPLCALRAEHRRPVRESTSRRVVDGERCGRRPPACR